MCVIVELKPGQMLPRGKFNNMVWNNWHSYGIVTLFGDNTMDVCRRVPESGENDPEEIWKLLNRDIEYTRLLHVRHTTVGETTIENCHPFDIYFNEKQNRRLLFMHNGTMTEYKPRKWVYNEEYTPPRNYTAGGSYEDDDSGKSDTMNYAETILTPYLSSMSFGEGCGDIRHPLALKFLAKFWPAGNRGLLIANDQPHVFLGDWKTIKTEDGQEIKVSNTDYFDTLKRGPLFDRLQKEAEAKRHEEQEERRNTSRTFQGSGTSVTTTVVSLSDYQFHKKTTGYELPSSLKNLCNDMEVWDRESAVNLGYATYDELKELYSDEGTCLTIMNWIFADYADLYDENDELEARIHLAEEKIEKMQGHLDRLGAERKKA